MLGLYVFIVFAHLFYNKLLRGAGEIQSAQEIDELYKATSCFTWLTERGWWVKECSAKMNSAFVEPHMQHHWNCSKGNPVRSEREKESDWQSDRQRQRDRGRERENERFTNILTKNCAPHWDSLVVLPSSYLVLAVQKYSGSIKKIFI